MESREAGDAVIKALNQQVLSSILKDYGRDEQYDQYSQGCVFDADHVEELGSIILPIAPFFAALLYILSFRR